MPDSRIDVPALLRTLADDRAAADLRDYFAEHGDRSALFTGRRFESLAGGGDGPGVHARVTAADLVAVTLLSVQLPAETAIDLLDGALGEDVAALLREIPTTVALADDESAGLVADGAPADRAWTMLTGCHGVGPVTASKLLARKRPQLLPVYDDVVRCVLGRPARFWTALRDALRADGMAVVHRLDELRAGAGVPPHVSTLRVLDVVLWMRHHSDHRRARCSGPM